MEPRMTTPDPAGLREAALGLDATLHWIKENYPKALTDMPSVYFRNIARFGAALATPAPLDVETLRRVFHEDYEMQDFGCKHGNQHRKSWDCWGRATEVMEAAARLSKEPDR